MCTPILEQNTADHYKIGKLFGSFGVIVLKTAKLFGCKSADALIDKFFVKL